MKWGAQRKRISADRLMKSAQVVCLQLGECYGIITANSAWDWEKSLATAEERNTMNQETRSTGAEAMIDDGLTDGYKKAIEKAITHLPVKNGVVNIDSIWIETSLPFEILNNILRREDLTLPDNVERINLKSNVRPAESIRKSRRKRRRKPRSKGKSKATP